VSVPSKSRTYRFPKSRSKNFKPALKLAKGLPGYKKVESLYEVTFGPTDAASDDLWELLKLSARWKGAAFLFDDEEVEQEAWEKSFQDASSEEPEKAEEAEKDEPKAEKPKESKKDDSKAEKPKKDEPKAEKAKEAKKDEPKAEKAKESKKDEPKAEKAKEAKKDEPKAEKAKESKKDEPKAEKAKDAKKDDSEADKAKDSKKDDSKSDKDEKKSTYKPKVVQINPAPKPDNSGCGKKAAVLMIAAMGILNYLFG
jgi:hypothetical protein